MNAFGEETQFYSFCERGDHASASKLGLKEINTSNVFGWTPLMAALANGHIDTAKLLVKNGAVLECCDVDGCTLMFEVCLGGHLDCAKWLYEKGCRDVRTKNKYGKNPMYAACVEGHIEVAKWLYAHGAADDIHTLDDQGYSLLEMARMYDRKDVVAWLAINL